MFPKTMAVKPLRRRFERSAPTIDVSAHGRFEAQRGFPACSTMWDRKTGRAAPTGAPDPQSPALSAPRPTDGRAAVSSRTRVAWAGLEPPHVKRSVDDRCRESGDHSSVEPRPKPTSASPAGDRIFAALDCGNRPHGASTRHGTSVFERSVDCEKPAIVFAIDAFTPVFEGSPPGRPKPARIRRHQAGAGAFGGAIPLAVTSRNPDRDADAEALLREPLTAARGVGMPKPDADAEDMLIEAHPFREIPMEPRCVTRGRISRSERPAGGATEASVMRFAANTGPRVVFVP